MDFVYVGSLQVLRSLKVMVISRDADNGFLALITFSAEFTDTDRDTDTDTDTGNLHTLYRVLGIKIPYGPNLTHRKKTPYPTHHPTPTHH